MSAKLQVEPLSALGHRPLGLRHQQVPREENVAAQERGFNHPRVPEGQACLGLPNACFEGGRDVVFEQPGR